MDPKENNTEVKEFVQKVEVEPTKDTELIDEETETQEESSPQETKPEEEESTEAEPTEKEEEADGGESTTEDVEPAITEPKPVANETPRERALRMEATRLKGLLRKERSDELLGGLKPADATPVVDDELAQYDQEELKRFEKLATKMGFAKKDDINNQNSQEKMNDEFTTFIESHPEYSPENDKDGVLWNQLKSEFGLYQPPKDPKTLRKILAKVHNEISGIQPAANLTKINASREKIKVASHTGASTDKVTRQTPRQNTTGLRTDMLKGFGDDEIKELVS